MRILAYLTPRFLSKVDAHLLQNYPIIWETKIVYALYYSAIVANLALVVLGFMIPVSRSYVPDFEYFVPISVGIGTLLASLGLAYYAYQQSFVSIKYYTTVQTLLRYLLYLLVVFSMGFNILTLPQTVSYRVKWLYPKESVEQDFAAIAKVQMLRDFLLYLEDREYIFRDKPKHLLDIRKTLQKTPLATHGEVDAFLKFFKAFEEIIDERKIKNRDEKIAKYEYLNKYVEHKTNIDTEKLQFLKEDVRRLKAEVGKQSWDKTLKKQILEQLNYENILFSGSTKLQYFNIELAIPHIQKIYTRYPIETALASEGHIYECMHTQGYKHQVYDNMRNIYKYHNANVLLQITFYIKSRQNVMPAILLTDTDIHRALYAGHYAISQYIEKYKDDVNGTISTGEVLKHCANEFSNKERLELALEDVIKNFDKQPLVLYFPLAILAMFISVWVLIAKILSWRSLFVSALAMVCAGFGWILGFLLYAKYFKIDIKALLETYSKENYFDNMLQTSNFFMFTIFLGAMLYAFYTHYYKKHNKFFEMGWVFWLFCTSVIAVFVTISCIQQCILSYDFAFSEAIMQFFICYGISVLGALGMYIAHQNMMYLPTKR